MYFPTWSTLNYLAALFNVPDALSLCARVQNTQTTRICCGRTAQLPADHIPPAPKKIKSHLTPHPHVTRITSQARRKRIVSDSGFPPFVSRCRWQRFFVSRGASTNGDFMSIRSLRSYLLLLLFTSYFRIYCISWVYWLLLMCRAHKPANSCHLHVNLTVPQNEFQTKTKCFQN